VRYYLPIFEEIYFNGQFLEKITNIKFEKYLFRASVVLVDYLLSALSRILLEKPTGSQLVKKFPSIYGTRIFIIAFASARHQSLS